LVITKRPRAGHTKTRLTPPLSPEQAAELFECFLLDTLNLVRAVSNVTRFILFTPPDEADYFREIAPDFELLVQQGKGLGERLHNALSHCLSNGFDQVVIMNSDGPTLPISYLNQAFARLEEAEATFGPSEDGGYYLIGLTRPQPRLLREVRMSTPRVLQDTLALADQENVRVALLPQWYDIDTIHDLRRLAGELRESNAATAHYTRTFLMSLNIKPEI
jgi:hypothetical protein